ncbi:oligosaccharide flippase family protein [Nocardioides halotolerans]|jgi:PST family polysaccharide transporter|uniref:oligosaccharide flippase family protein n=1 Tax=Nocardioides halotolerans TaxID=433660 RepID=UPI0003FD7435|nr:oligosaccharide flippase family protein [Nocardioides halotolerans]
MTDQQLARPAVTTGPAALAEPDVGSDSASAIGRRAGRGLGWALVGTLVFKAGSFVISLVMVRLLAPHDFGLYAVALAANAFLIHVNDMGMIAATVQWRGDIKEMAATARTMAIGFSLGWYALFWLAAPFIADLANSPDATLLVRLMSLTIILDGVTSVSVGVIQREFRQDRLMMAIAIGFVFNAAVSVTLAVQGAGAFSFVLGAITQSLVVGALVLRMAGVPVRLGLRRDIAARLLVFGTPLALGLGIESVLMYSDAFIVGHQLGTDTLGFYLLAFNISSWVPGIVGVAVRYVSIPAFSRLSEGDHDDFALGVHRTLVVLVGVVAPIAAAMATLSPAIVDVLYGREWAPAADALRFLAFVMVARMFTAMVFDIQTGRGKTSVTITLNLVWLTTLVPALWYGTSRGGMQGAAAGHAAVALLVAIPFAAWMLHRSGVDMRPVLRLLARPVLAAVAAGATMLLVAVPLDSPAATLFLAGGCGCLVYVLLAVPAQGRAIVRDRVVSALASRRPVRG